MWRKQGGLASQRPPEAVGSTAAILLRQVFQVVAGVVLPEIIELLAV
jgi:hypothetical protein